MKFPVSAGSHRKWVILGSRLKECQRVRACVRAYVCMYVCMYVRRRKERTNVENDLFDRRAFVFSLLFFFLSFFFLSIFFFVNCTPLLWCCSHRRRRRELEKSSKRAVRMTPGSFSLVQTFLGVALLRGYVFRSADDALPLRLLLLLPRQTGNRPTSLVVAASRSPSMF